MFDGERMNVVLWHEHKTHENFGDERKLNDLCYIDAQLWLVYLVGVRHLGDCC